MEFFDKIDKWVIVDISRSIVPIHFESRIIGHASYIDTNSQNEHLYSVDYLLDDLPRQHARVWGKEDLEFLNRVKEIMEENDAFYFRLID